MAPSLGHFEFLGRRYSCRQHQAPACRLCVAFHEASSLHQRIGPGQRLAWVLVVGWSNIFTCGCTIGPHTPSDSTHQWVLEATGIRMQHPNPHNRC